MLLHSWRNPCDIVIIHFVMEENTFFIYVSLHEQLTEAEKMQLVPCQ